MASKRLSKRALAELIERAARARPQYQAENEYNFKPAAGDSNYRDMVNWVGNAPGQAADLAGQVGEAIAPMFSMKTPPPPLGDPGRSVEMMADPSFLRPYESHSNLPRSPLAKTMWGMTGLGGMSDVVDSIPAVADDVGAAVNDSTPGNVGTAALTALMALGSAFPFVPPLIRGSTDGKAGDALRRPGIGHNRPPKAKPKPKPRELLEKRPYSKYGLKEEDLTRYRTGTIVEDSENYGPARMFSPEDWDPNGSLMNLVGDRTNVGRLTTVGGERLDSPIILDGGQGYMRGLDTGAWASDRPIIDKLAKVVRGKDGRPVYGLYMPMAGQSSDFARMTKDVAMRNFDPRALRKKDIETFNNGFRNAKAYFKEDKTGVKRSTVADFPGIESPFLNQWLDEVGTRRAAFFDYMGAKQWASKGFPDVTAARYAIQDPRLRDVEAGTGQYGGQSMALMDPAGTSRPVSELPMQHNTYSTDLGGNYIGGLEIPVPRELLFPDWYAQRRLEGKALSGDNRAFQMKQASQPITNKLVDDVMKWMEANRLR